jgi:hypothetical protein
MNPATGVQSNTTTAVVLPLKLTSMEMTAQRPTALQLPLQALTELTPRSTSPLTCNPLSELKLSQ